MRKLFILLIPLALAGCVTGQEPTLPMALGPIDSAQAGCLQLGDAPTVDGCAASARSE